MFGQMQHRSIGLFLFEIVRSIAVKSPGANQVDARAFDRVAFVVGHQKLVTRSDSHAVGMSKRLMRRLFRCWLLCRFAFARICCLERFKDVVGDVDRRAEIKRVSDHEIVSLRARVILDFLKQ